MCIGPMCIVWVPRGIDDSKYIYVWISIRTSVSVAPFIWTAYSAILLFVHHDFCVSCLAIVCTFWFGSETLIFRHQVLVKFIPTTSKSIVLSNDSYHAVISYSYNPSNILRSCSQSSFLQILVVLVLFQRYFYTRPLNYVTNCMAQKFKSEHTSYQIEHSFAYFYTLRLWSDV